MKQSPTSWVNDCNFKKPTVSYNHKTDRKLQDYQSIHSFILEMGKYYSERLSILSSVTQLAEWDQKPSLPIPKLIFCEFPYVISIELAVAKNRTANHPQYVLNWEIKAHRNDTQASLQHSGQIGLARKGGSTWLELSNHCPGRNERPTRL